MRESLNRPGIGTDRHNPTAGENPEVFDSKRFHQLWYSSKHSLRMVPYLKPLYGESCSGICLVSCVLHWIALSVLNYSP